MRALALVVLAAIGCSADVDYAGTRFLCSDGQTCPPGYTCVDGRCRRGGAIDGGDSTGDGGEHAGMIAIPAGERAMGCDDQVVNDCPLDAEPVHDVSLSGFEIDRTEVTRAAYRACAEDGACSTPPVAAASDVPVTEVTWDQASAFCAWAGKRLPTEAEWERAARGADGSVFPWGDAGADCDLANFDGCGGVLLPVGGRPAGASARGVLDLAGNAAEWVSDRYGADYYEESPRSDPQGPATGGSRVVRGGSFEDDAEDVRGFAREAQAPDNPDPELGFRCAR